MSEHEERAREIALEIEDKCLMDQPAELDVDKAAAIIASRLREAEARGMERAARICLDYDDTGLGGMDGWRLGYDQGRLHCRDAIRAAARGRDG